MKRAKKSTGVHVMANDPSLTAWGWAVIDSAGTVVDSGAIKTKPSDKKLKLRKGDDNVRRIGELSQAIMDVIKKYNVQYLLSEQPHGSQSYSAAVMVGVSLSIMVTASQWAGIGMEWYTEGEAKKAMSDKKIETKDDMVELVSKKYKFYIRGVKWIDEAVADALAVYHVATKQSSVLKFLAR